MFSLSPATCSVNKRNACCPRFFIPSRRHFPAPVVLQNGSQPIWIQCLPPRLSACLWSGFRVRGSRGWYSRLPGFRSSSASTRGRSARRFFCLSTAGSSPVILSWCGQALDLRFPLHTSGFGLRPSPGTLHRFVEQIRLQLRLEIGSRKRLLFEWMGARVLALTS